MVAMGSAGSAEVIKVTDRGIMVRLLARSGLATTRSERHS
jgi:hypothetical protein